MLSAYKVLVLDDHAFQCAHLKDMPLHWQLTSRDAEFVGAFETAPNYRLYAIADSVPPKPALVHDEAGAAIKVEVYAERMQRQGHYVKVTEATLTYVAIDEAGRPRAIPPEVSGN